MRRLIPGILGIVLLSASAPQLKAFPDRPIRLIVPYGTGGITDITARIIGPRLAEAISSERQRLGAFAGPDDLERVAGIGPATVQRLRPLVSFK